MWIIILWIIVNVTNRHSTVPGQPKLKINNFFQHFLLLLHLQPVSLRRMPDNQASASAATPAAPAHSRGQTGGLIMPGAAQMAGAARPKSAQVNHE